MEESLISTLFSSDAVIISIIIAAIGISIRTGIGMVGKPIKDFKLGLTAISFVIGFLTASQIVVVAIENLPTDASPGVLLNLLIANVLVVMGLDAGIKSLGKKVPILIKEKKDGTDFTEPEPIDLEDDLPPGKDVTSTASGGSS